MYYWEENDLLIGSTIHYALVKCNNYLFVKRKIYIENNQYMSGLYQQELQQSESKAFGLEFINRTVLDKNAYDFLERSSFGDFFLLTNCRFVYMEHPCQHLTG